jgi:hypothetical protein
MHLTEPPPFLRNSEPSTSTGVTEYSATEVVDRSYSVDRGGSFGITVTEAQ